MKPPDSPDAQSHEREKDGRTEKSMFSYTCYTTTTETIETTRHLLGPLKTNEEKNTVETSIVKHAQAKVTKRTRRPSAIPHGGRHRNTVRKRQCGSNTESTSTPRIIFKSKTHIGDTHEDQRDHSPCSEPHTS